MKGIRAYFKHLSYLKKRGVLRKYFAYRAKRNYAAIAEFLFLDFKIILTVMIIIITLALLFYPYQNLLNLPTLENAIYVLESSVRTTSYFIGFLIALILLSFNIFYRYFGRYAFVGFFRNRIIKYLFTLFIINILVAQYTTSYLKQAERVDVYGWCLFYFSLLISVTLILL